MTAWERGLDAAVELRHALHRRPELSWAEDETARTIRTQLDRLGISWRVAARTGTVAVLAPDAPGRHVALRADIDAMPITETSGVPWSSQVDGAMHACGHDGHTATLLAAARWLKAHESDLNGPVTLLFQPAEEGGHGAKYMIEDGALDGVDVIFGWHNWPAIPYGQALCPDGPVMSANGTFEIQIDGQGGHASQPEATRDPVLAAAAITMALQQIVARRQPAHRAVVLSVSSIEAPSAHTVTPHAARIGGSIRVPDLTVRDEVFDLIERIARDVAAGYGVDATTERQPRYGATVNHPEPAAEFRGYLEAELGPTWPCTTVPSPVLASEDFSYYLDVIPGAFALVGADDGPSHRHPCHSPHYDFNDRLIPVVARLLVRAAGGPLPPSGPNEDRAN